MITLFSLAEGIRTCTACPLYKNRLLAVPGEGPANAKIMFVGEAPGADEDHLGRPFVGRSGKFLDELMNTVGIKREDVFITGACKCRPPQNRTPTVSELKTCRQLWLDQQIEVIKPRVIVLLGSAALRSVLGLERVTPVRGRFIIRNGQQYFVTYHPAAGMRFPKIGAIMHNDFQQLIQKIKNKKKKLNSPI